MGLRWSGLIAVAMFAAVATAAQAAPPTVVPSPGYDARLQEQRAATGPKATPLVPGHPPVVHRRVKRKGAQ
jgi:hypothetical protein